jgi:hypothetical protein
VQVPEVRTKRRRISLGKTDSPTSLQDSRPSGLSALPEAEKQRRTRLTKRTHWLLSRAKLAETDARYWRVAMNVWDVVIREAGNTELRERCQLVAFEALCRFLAESDPRFAAALAHGFMPQLSDEAARIVVSNLEHGPRILQAISHDPDLFAKINSMSAVEQAVELGRLLESLRQGVRK